MRSVVLRQQPPASNTRLSAHAHGKTRDSESGGNSGKQNIMDSVHRHSGKNNNDSCSQDEKTSSSEERVGRKTRSSSSKIKQEKKTASNTPDSKNTRSTQKQTKEEGRGKPPGKSPRGKHVPCISSDSSSSESEVESKHSGAITKAKGKTAESAKLLSSRKLSQDSSKAAENSELSSKSNSKLRQNKEKSTMGPKDKDEKSEKQLSNEGNSKSKRGCHVSKSTAKNENSGKLKYSKTDGGKKSDNKSKLTKGLKMSATSKGKVKEQDLPKSVRVYREIYSSSDEYSSTEDEAVTDPVQAPDLVLNKDPEREPKKVKEIKKETSKATSKSTMETKNQHDSKKTKVTTVSSILRGDDAKKRSLGSFRIPKKKPAEHGKAKTCEKLDDKSDAFGQDSSTPRATSSTPKNNGKIISPLLTSSDISPLHMTGVCDLSPGMLNLLPVRSRGNQPMMTSTPVSRTTTDTGIVVGAGGGTQDNQQRSLHDLLSRCQDVFANKPEPSTEKETLGHNERDVVRLPEPPSVTRVTDGRSGQSGQVPPPPVPPTAAAALPAVLTGLFSGQTPPASSRVTQTSRDTGLPAALAALLPGTPVPRQPTQEPGYSNTPSSSLPEPLVKLMGPLAGGSDSRKLPPHDSPATAPLLPPDLARLLPPGVRSLSPTPGTQASETVYNDSPNKSIAQSASEATEIQEDKLTQATAEGNALVVLYRPLSYTKLIDILSVVLVGNSFHAIIVIYFC